MKKRLEAELLPGILVSLAFSFLVFLYAPIDLYCANTTEFLFEIWDLLPVALMLFLPTFVVMSLLYLGLYHWNIHLYHAGLAVGMILFLATYIQGNFLVNHLPPLDGTTVNWADYDSGRLPSILVWGIVTVIICVVCFFAKKFFYHTILPFVCGCMTLMLLVTAVSEMISNDVFSERNHFVATAKNEFTFSENKNFVILLLDALDARDFSELLDTHPEYQEMFSDFTYYENTMSGYPYTQCSVPYILSGEYYENAEDFEDYMVRVYRSSLFEKLQEQGYRMDYYEKDLYVDDRDMEEMPFENVAKEHFQTRLSLQFIRQELKLIGFRYAPYDLKKSFFLKKSGFDELSEQVRNIPVENFNETDSVFYDLVKNTEPEVDDTTGYFKFIHLEGAHVPFVYDKDVNIISEYQGSYTQNIEACMTLTKAYLDSLKNAGVYDNAVLIIMSDHGYEKGNDSWGRQCPILLIKGRDEHHDTIQKSKAPIIHGDLQQAYVRLLDGAQSEDVFDWKEGDVRERRYLYYVYLNENHMKEYMQTGEASDLDTLLPTGREYNR